jgi:hypothetical protein
MPGEADIRVTLTGRKEGPMTDGFWFKSTRFEIEPGEDEDINLGIYGRQVAVWLKRQLEEAGFEVEEIINEDWGRCLMCARSPFSLWVGVGSADEDAATAGARGDVLPDKANVIWHCFATTELFFIKRLFVKQSAMDEALANLNELLRKILEAEPTIELVPEP